MRSKFRSKAQAMERVHPEQTDCPPRPHEATIQNEMTTTSHVGAKDKFMLSSCCLEPFD